MPAAFRRMLEEDRKRSGFSISQVAWRLGIKPAEYRRIEEEVAWPDWETYHRISTLFGWPETYVTRSRDG